MTLTEEHREGWDDFVHNPRPQRVEALEIIERFKAFQDFYGLLPRGELVKRGWVQSRDDLASLAPMFFAQRNTHASTLFRKSATADHSLLALWQARARATAEYTCVAETPGPFASLDKAQLRKLAHLSVDPLVVRTLPAKLRQLGILLVYLPALPRMKADGVVFKLSSGHPVVALSLRFGRLDYFWFTLMHELAHVVLHASKLDQPIFVDVEVEEDAIAEKAANKLAKDSFVERSSWRNCEPKYNSGSEVVVKYAREQGIHPSIVAGLLRRETGNYTRYSEIINEYDVRDILFPS